MNKLQYLEIDDKGFKKAVTFENDDCEMTIYRFMSDVIYPLLISIGYHHDLINDVFDVDEMFDRGALE